MHYKAPSLEATEDLPVGTVGSVGSVGRVF